jgi:hypothetical protein
LELTLASALSPQGLVGHLAYVLLVMSMLMRVMTWLRILVIVSALLAIFYGAFILHDPVTVFWETLLVLVNLGQLALTHWRSLRARFTTPEREFIARHLPDLTRGEARALIDRGHWVDLPSGTSLAVEGQPVGQLSYLASGSAQVQVQGRVVAYCRPGDFVGEMTALTGLPATATVLADGPISTWQIDAAGLRDLARRRDRISLEIEAAFARNYRDKIVAMNRLVAAGGAAAAS